MNHEVGNTFDSLESAHEFVGLLAEAVAGAKKDIEGDVQRESSLQFPRRLQALRVALYNLERLESHMSKSRRILNDLRSLRRLLFEERKAGATMPSGTQASKTGALTKPLPAIPPVPTNGSAVGAQTSAAA
jgi:hypothetical protein